MLHVERAGQYMENPANGNRITPYLLGGAVVSNPVTALKVGGFSSMAKALFTTQAGKRILLSASELPPGSVKFENLLKMTQKIGTLSSANASND